MQKSCVSIMVLFCVASTASTPCRADLPQTSEPAARTMQVVVLGPDEKPLSGARIHVSVWTKDPFKANREYACDAKGIATVELPQHIDTLRLWARHDGHVALFAQWWPERETRPREIPKAFTFRLDRGTEIGGIVKDEDGRPIVGARLEIMLVVPRNDELEGLHPTPNLWLAEGEDAVTTNARGHWTFNAMPAGEEYTVQVKLNHPEYISDEKWGGLQNEQAVATDDFRKRTGTIVMRRGLILTGRVTDGDGKPISGAIVVRGKDPYSENGSQEVRTNNKGDYLLPPLPLGGLLLTVVAKGWAPIQREVPLSADSQPADFTLQRGKRLRMLFVDENGSPVPEVSVSIEKWHGNRALYNIKHSSVLDTQIPRKADENGLYEWMWAPEGEVTYGCYKEGFEEIRDLRLVPEDDKEFVVKLQKL